MQHCDPTVLSLVALGEQPSAQDAAHLESCSSCQRDVADLGAVVSAVRVEVPSGPPVAPAARVWAAIAAQTGVGVAPTALRPRELAPAAVLPLRPRERGGRGRWRLLAVAASALVIGAVGGSTVTYLTGRDSASNQLVVAQVGLRALPLAPGAGGTAMVVRTAAGPTLDVDVSALAPLSGEFYEVWLIDTSVRKMVPVGVLRGRAGEFVIPSGLDLGQYPVVDVSVQRPGDPRHSGKSVLRGTLPA